MSYTTVKAIWPGEKAEDLCELKNAWGSAPAIWRPICDKYLDEPVAYLSRSDELWPLAQDHRLPRHHRAVLAMTYDNAYIAAKDYARAAEDIRAFQRDLPPPPDSVNHWPEIARIIETATCPAIGFHMTSVGEDLWSPRYDEDDNPLPFDWSQPWDVYEKLNDQPDDIHLELRLDRKE